MRRAADVLKKIAPAHTEKCPQKSTGFDKGTDICGFVADICGHTPTSAKIYANVRGSLHMSAAYARPVADIEGTGTRPERLAGFDTLAELGHQGAAGRGVGTFFFIRVNKLCRRPIEPSAIFLDETVPAPLAAIRPDSFRMLEAYRAAGIPWLTVSSLPYTTASEATGRGSQPSRSWRLQPR